MPDLVECLGKGLSTAAAGGCAVLALVTVPQLGARLLRFQRPTSWDFYGTIMFAKPTAIGVAVATPYLSYLHYSWAADAEGAAQNKST
mmetsp:Transcript_25089/g.65432  ORF Transcript_25089/g.65432 Transcript_25089/m.65432 type:complete len:88 (+) Transcript_25089:216-479(+)